MLSKSGRAEIYSFALGLVTYTLHLTVRHPSGTPAVHSRSVSQNVSVLCVSGLAAQTRCNSAVRFCLYNANLIPNA